MRQRLLEKGDGSPDKKNESKFSIGCQTRLFLAQHEVYRVYMTKLDIKLSNILGSNNQSFLSHKKFQQKLVENDS
jgi:hypothetical protein